MISNLPTVFGLYSVRFQIPLMEKISNRFNHLRAHFAGTEYLILSVSDRTTGGGVCYVITVVIVLHVVLSNWRTGRDSNPRSTPRQGGALVAMLPIQKFFCNSPGDIGKSLTTSFAFEAGIPALPQLQKLVRGGGFEPRYSCLLMRHQATPRAPVQNS